MSMDLFNVCYNYKPLIRNVLYVIYPWMLSQSKLEAHVFLIMALQSINHLTHHRKYLSYKTKDKQYFYHNILQNKVIITTFTKNLRYMRYNVHFIVYMSYNITKVLSKYDVLPNTLCYLNYFRRNEFDRNQLNNNLPHSWSFVFKLTLTFCYLSFNVST